MEELIIQNTETTIISHHSDGYISLTDMADSNNH